MQKRHRVFVAINLPPEIKKELGRYQERFLDLPAKWTNKEHLHITLLFVGEVTDVELAEVCAAVKQVAEANHAFSLTLNNVRYGPENLPIPKFVWVKGEKSNEAIALKSDLEKTLEEKIGFKPENRGFMPHITLARISSMAFRGLDLEERPEINEVTDLSFDVNTIEVMESVKKKEGVAYEVIESHELQS